MFVFISLRTGLLLRICAYAMFLVHKFDMLACKRYLSLIIWKIITSENIINIMWTVFECRCFTTIDLFVCIQYKFLKNGGMDKFKIIKQSVRSISKTRRYFAFWCLLHKVVKVIDYVILFIKQKCYYSSIYRLNLRPKE